MRSILENISLNNFCLVVSKLGITNRQIVYITAISLFLAVIEGVGLASLMPIFSSFQDNQNMSSHLINNFFSMFNINLSIKVFILISCILILIRQIVNFIKDREIILIRENIELKYRKEMLITSLKSNLFSLNNSSNGDFVNFIINEPHNVCELTSNIFRMIFCVILMVIYVALMILLSVKLTVLFLSSIFFIWVLMGKFSLIAYKAGNITKNKTNELYKSIGEIFRGIKFIKLNTSEKRVVDYMDEVINVLFKGNVKYGLIKAFVEAINPILFIGVLVLIFFINNYFFSVPNVTLGVFLGVIYRMYSIFTNLNSERVAYSRRIANYENFNNFYEKVGSSIEKKPGKEKFRFKKALAFENVTFRYSDDTSNVIENTSFEILKNKTVAIVGKSGSGKSTIVDMICDFYKPSSGKIRLDSSDYKDFSTKTIRENIGIVSQRTFLFKNTIKFNLLYGTNNPKNNDIWKALEKSGLKEYIKTLDDQLMTMIGEDGALLSGGQRQRLSFARCILQNKKFIILDEPISSIDTETAKILLKSLNDLKGKATIIIISHDIAATRNADYILELKDKKISMRRNKF